MFNFNRIIFLTRNLFMKVNLEMVRQGAKKAVVVGLLVFGGADAFAQKAEKDNPYVKLGQKALIDGDFRTAVTNLEKALPTDPQNLDIQYMLGYSQYQSNDYRGATKSFSSVLKGRPEDVSAYYYRAKAQNTLAVDPESRMSDSQRSTLLQASIQDYNKAIEINDTDIKLYQNRAMAYRDLGNLIGTTSSKNYDKAAALDAYNRSIKDLELVLKRNPNRKDVALELKKLKVYKSSL